MRLTVFAAALAAATTLALAAAPADAAPKKKRVVAANGSTVYVSRDESGRARTRIIVQRRSYLDPGTEVFPGENSDHRYAFPPNHTATSVLDNTVFGGNQTALPGPFTLPSKNNPFIAF